MSIERNTTPVLQQDASPFTTMFNDVLQGITNTAALGVYCYLASKSSGWEINKKELRRHFQCGREHIQMCFNNLRELGLIEIVTIRDKKGRIVSCLWNLKRHIPTNCTNESARRVSRTTDNPSDGKSAPINKRYKEIKDINNKSIAKNKKFGLSEMVESNPEHIETELIEQWLENRKKFPVNRATWKRINRVLSELRLLGISPHEAFERMVASHWRSIEVSYFHQEISQKTRVGKSHGQWTVDSVMDA